MIHFGNHTGKRYTIRLRKDCQPDPATLAVLTMTPAKDLRTNLRDLAPWALVSLDAIPENRGPKEVEP